MDMRNKQLQKLYIQALKIFKSVEYSFIEMRAKVTHRNFSNNMK